MKNKTDPEIKSRLPPGQHLTARFPVLQNGRVVHVERENFRLEITGEVEQPTSLSLNELEELKDIEIVEDIHCVTSWSKFDTKWGGISFNKLFNIIFI